MVPHDHEEILPDDVMLRGIPERHILPVEGGGVRISSGAFQTSSDGRGGGFSLSAKKVLDCLGKSVDEWAAGRFGAVVCFPAEVLREAKMRIGWDPTPDDPSHCNAWGALGKSLRKRLARHAKRRFLAS